MVFVVTHSQKIKVLQLLLVVSTVSIQKVECPVQIMKQNFKFYLVSNILFLLNCDLLSLETCHGKWQWRVVGGQRGVSFCSWPPPLLFRDSLMQDLSLPQSPWPRQSDEFHLQMVFYHSLRTRIPVCVHLRPFPAEVFWPLHKIHDILHMSDIWLICAKPQHNLVSPDQYTCQQLFNKVSYPNSSLPWPLFILLKEQVFRAISFLILHTYASCGQTILTALFTALSPEPGTVPST